MEGPPAALRPSRHQDAGTHSGPTRLPIVTGKGETAVIDPHAKDISGRPEVFDETHLAAVRAYVGQDRYIDGTFDPLTCTLTKERDPGAAPEPAPEPEPEPEPKPVMTEAQLAKLERNRKKRAKKKAKKRAAKSQAEAGAMVTPNAAANGKIFGSEQGVEREGWHSATMHHKSPTDVREDKPLGKADYLRGMGFGRREREKIATFERLTRLTGLADTLRDDGMCASIGGQLEKFVVEAGQVDTITGAREICAKLCNIANDLIAEVEHTIKYPEEAYGRDVTVLAPLRDKLRELEQELAHRAGEPELMKTEAAERMRQKLEKRLLPKLKVSCPRWAEQLRFMHMEVLKWKAPKRSQVLVDQEAEEARQAQAQRAERQRRLQLEHEEQLAKERPDEEEVRILESMGWAADSDASAAAGAEAAGGGGGPGMGLTIEEPDELDPIPED